MLLLNFPTFSPENSPCTSCVARATVKIEKLHLTQKFNVYDLKIKLLVSLKNNKFLFQKSAGATIHVVVPATCLIFALFVQV